MRCPKCGAFLEEGRTKCFMCGADLTAQDYNDNYNNNSIPQFNNYNNQSKSYQDINLETLTKKDKDIFDFFSEHKKGIKIFFLIVLVAVGGFVGYKVYNNIKNPKTKPVLKNLYYEIEDGFINVSNNQTTLIYTKTGQKGIACSISVSTGTDTDGNHVKTYFDKMYDNLAPKEEKDKTIDVMDQIEKKESEFTQKGTTWHNMNIFYRNEDNLEFTIMRYQYLTSIYNGYYYNIELINYSNDLQCTNALDKFRKSLEFIE